MAINMMCMNDECKYYYEDSCTRNLEEKRIVIDVNGNCETFEVGKSDYYLKEEEANLIEDLKNEGGLI